MIRFSTFYKGFTLLALISACEQSADLAIPAQSPKLNVYSSFGAGDNHDWIFVISQSKSIVDTTSISQFGIPNAEISVFENDVLLPSPQLVDIQEYFLNGFDIGGQFPATGMYLSNIKPQAGSQYRLILSSEGIGTIEAESRIPDKVEILTVELDTVMVEDVNQIAVTGANARLRFKDPGNQPNFYHLFVEISPDETSLNVNNIFGPQLRVNNPELNLDTNEDDILSEYQTLPGGIFFRDAIFDGQEYEISFSIAAQLLVRFLRGNAGEEFSTLNVRFALRNLTEENYWYHVTTRLQLSVRNDPFAEPVQVRSNLEDGFGLFAGFNQDEVIVILE